MLQWYQNFFDPPTMENALNLANSTAASKSLSSSLPSPNLVSFPFHFGEAQQEKISHAEKATIKGQHFVINPKIHFFIYLF